MRAGITGTRKGMTTIQWQTVFELMIELYGGLDDHEWHDGDCVGADAQAHGSIDHINAMRADSAHIRTVGHPMRPDTHRAYMEFDRLLLPKPPLVRNRNIVDSIHRLIAAPYQYNELMRKSGTWATMRYAVRQQRYRTDFELIVVWPDGTLQEDFVPPSMRK